MSVIGKLNIEDQYIAMASVNIPGCSMLDFNQANDVYRHFPQTFKPESIPSKPHYIQYRKNILH